MLKHQMARILIATVGIVSTTAMYRPYAFLNEIAHPNALYWFYGLLLITFLTGLLIELIPFPKRLAPAWGVFAVTVASGLLIFLLHSPVVVAVTGRFAPIELALVSARWMAPMGGLAFGVLIGKAVKGESAKI